MSGVVIRNPLCRPVGRTGGALAALSAADLATMILVALIGGGADEAHRRDARFVLETLGIAGGQGLAAVFEVIR